MEKSLAMVEYSTVPSGMAAADLLSKTAEIQFLKAKTVCPGKFIVLFCGELAALKSTIEATRLRFQDKLIDSFVLGNPHESIFSVLENERRISGSDNLQNDTLQVKKNQIDTLGIIETETAASAIRAADITVKAAKVRLLEIRLAKSMCGKAYVLFTGSIASVEESVQAANKQLGDSGIILDYAIIPAPDERFIESLNNSYL